MKTARPFCVGVHAEKNSPCWSTRNLRHELLEFLDFVQACKEWRWHFIAWLLGEAGDRRIQTIRQYAPVRLEAECVDFRSRTGAVETLADLAIPLFEAIVVLVDDKSMHVEQILLLASGPRLTRPAVFVAWINKTGNPIDLPTSRFKRGAPARQLEQIANDWNPRSCYFCSVAQIELP